MLTGLVQRLSWFVSRNWVVVVIRIQIRVLFQGVIFCCCCSYCICILSFGLPKNFKSWVFRCLGIRGNHILDGAKLYDREIRWMGRWQFICSKWLCNLTHCFHFSEAFSNHPFLISREFSWVWLNQWSILVNYSFIWLDMAGVVIQER